jgi:hypothetical protein
MKKTRRGFKLKSPFDVDPVARYEVPFMPDNMQDDSGLVAKANKNGTMIINKNIKPDDPIRKNAQSHEEHHLRDMMDGKLDYDDNAVYHNLDGKGVKKVDRKNFNESDKSLPWEKNAYKAGNNLEEKDMRPKPNKLTGPPNMYESDTPLSFVKQMGRKRRTADSDTVSMNEKFGPSMVKRFGPGAFEISNDTDISGNSDGDPVKKEDYTGAYVSYSPSSQNFVYTSDRGDGGSKRIKSMEDLTNLSRKKKGQNFDYSGRLDLDEDFGNKTGPEAAGDRASYNRGFESLIKNTSKARKEFSKNNNYFKNNPDAFKPSEMMDSGKGDNSKVQYTLSPDFKWDDKQTNNENMNRMEYVQSFFDQEGKPSDKYAGGKLKFGRSHGDADDQKYLDGTIINQYVGKNTKFLADNFTSGNKELQEFAKNHPNTFRIIK